jgi:hypothetical protein
MEQWRIEVTRTAGLPKSESDEEPRLHPGLGPEEVAAGAAVAMARLVSLSQTCRTCRTSRTKRTGTAQYPPFGNIDNLLFVASS